ncbi:MAG TPA: glycerophosphodiester phosphodiesterase, partial [Chitinophagaceae bacterium]|nr:glycerophosphodiester phosphodiesterase [Chitinophagaceae bacterium]
MTTEKPANQPEKFDKQGHRGCRGLMPENTVAAMLYALNLNVTTLEMDVVISKDKKVVLS